MMEIWSRIDWFSVFFFVLMFYVGFRTTTFLRARQWRHAITQNRHHPHEFEADGEYHNAFGEDFRIRNTKIDDEIARSVRRAGEEAYFGADSASPRCEL